MLTKFGNIPITVHCTVHVFAHFLASRKIDTYIKKQVLTFEVGQQLCMALSMEMMVLTSAFCLPTTSHLPGSCKTARRQI